MGKRLTDEEAMKNVRKAFPNMSEDVVKEFEYQLKLRRQIAKEERANAKRRARLDSGLGGCLIPMLGIAMLLAVVLV
jgi:hypothetical protein